MGKLLRDWDAIPEAISLLKEGKIIAFPTETVYGMACLASSEKGFEALVKAKRRPADKPFTLMVGSLAEVAKYGVVDAKIIALAKEFMPGEVTFLLKARNGLPKHIDLGTGVIGIRFCNNPHVNALIEELGEPLLVPSANRSGEAPLKTGKEVEKEFLDDLSLIFDGECVDQTPSTVVDLSTPGEIRKIRDGKLDFGAILLKYNEDVTSKIAIACDHGGFILKEAAKKHLSGMGYEVLDFGTDSEASCDYPLFAFAAAKSVARGECDKGILFCTSGEGISMAANKIKGIRCGIGYDDIATAKTVEHNFANMVAFGQKYMQEADVLRRIDIFLIEKPSTVVRYGRRLKQILDIE